MILDEPITPTDPGDFQDAPESLLTPQQRRVIDLIASGLTITEAANSVSLHRNTVGNWRRHVPGFAHELEFAIAEQTLFWHEEAMNLAPEAIRIIRTIMHNPVSSPSLKFRAASMILKMAANPKNMHKPAQPPTDPHQQNDQQPESKQPQIHEVDIAALFQPLPDIPRQSAQQPIRRSPEPGRNSLCPCGSNLKYMRCCANLPTNPTPPPANASPYSLPSTQAPI